MLLAWFTVIVCLVLCMSSLVFVFGELVILVVSDGLGFWCWRDVVWGCDYW